MPLCHFFPLPIQRLLQEVDLAYKYANQTLLDVLFKSENLIERLRYVPYFGLSFYSNI